jgi:hypothetical protein
MTAVEQLVNYIKENFYLTDESLQKFEEAKQMEKIQMIKFANDYIDDDDIRDLTAEQYYNQTYSNNTKTL